MEDEMLTLYELLENPNKIRLEKEVFSLFVTMIESEQTISPAIEKIFHILPNCLRINNFNIGIIFHLINYMLYLGKGFVQNNLKSLEQVVEVCSFCLLGNEENEGEVNQSLAALILQSVILVINYFIFFLNNYLSKKKRIILMSYLLKSGIKYFQKFLLELMRVLSINS